jgi:hypothetical protein
MKICTFFYFCGSFLPSWIRIRNLNADPEPATQINADPCGSGNGDGSGSTTLAGGRRVKDDRKQNRLAPAEPGAQLHIKIKI